MRAVRFLFACCTLLLACGLLAGCGYNQIQRKDEGIKAAWSEVVNQYQRRADLVPNLVATVKGYAAHEERVFREVTEARAKVGQVTVNTDDAASLAKFEAVQGELSSALTRLMAVSENYPNLKADALFQNLQAQLEGTENRITVARHRYVLAVQDYNGYIRTFPVNLTAKAFGYRVKPNFAVENEAAIATAPKVDFGGATTPPPPAPAAPVAPVPPSAPVPASSMH
jgi:LemA protein